MLISSLVHTLTLLSVTILSVFLLGWSNIEQFMHFDICIWLRRFTTQTFCTLPVTVSSLTFIALSITAWILESLWYFMERDLWGKTISKVVCWIVIQSISCYQSDTRSPGGHLALHSLSVLVLQTANGLTLNCRRQGAWINLSHLFSN